MSHPQSHNPVKHGTALTYVTGFILSIIFTLIPYYLVKNHGGTNRFLFLAILGLGLFQLIIQVVYFLHLGRKPKPYFELYFFAATISIILIVVGGSVVIINNLHSNMNVNDQRKKLINDEAIYQINGKVTGACQATHINHQITIIYDNVTPRHLIADKCDTLTFINADSQSHSITFGVNSEYSSYAGESELNLRPGKTKTITLSESGGYNYHDIRRPLITGSFIVFNKD